MIYFPSPSTYPSPTRLCTQKYLELKMNKLTHSLHKECFNNPPNITISSLWSSGFANDSQEQDAWAQMGTRRNPEKNYLFLGLWSFLFVNGNERKQREVETRGRSEEFPSEKRGSGMTP